MKKHIFNIASLMMLLTLGGGLSSCSDSYLEDVNTDDSKAETIDPNAQLTTALLQTYGDFSLMDTYRSYITGFTQYYAGGWNVSNYAGAVYPKDSEMAYPWNRYYQISIKNLVDAIHRTGDMPNTNAALRIHRAYMMAALFVVGNIVLPQLCHLMPQGGLVWLPIYFFTLVAAYKFGLTAGLLTAIASPVVNSLLFGMPAAASLPIILVKSILLAVAAAFIASRVRGVALWAVALAVVAYQGIGMMAEWGMTGSLTAALQDIRLGWPGMLVQIFGGFAIIKLIKK